MTDLRERLERTSTAFVDGIGLDDPSHGEISGDIDGSERSARGAWWLVAAALVAIVAAGALVLPWRSGGSVATPAGPGETSSGSTAPTSPDGWVGLAPDQALVAAVEASLAEPGFVVASSIASPTGEIANSPTSYSPNRRTTIDADGRIAINYERMDGTRLTNEIYDLAQRRQYWLTGPDQWASAPMSAETRPSPADRLDDLAQTDGCVLRLSAAELLVVQSPAGRCPSSAPAPVEWASLGRGLAVVAIDDVGRVASISTLTDELDLGVADLDGVRLVDRYSDYGSAPRVELPDAASVTPLDTAGDGAEYDPTTGFVSRVDATP